MGEKDVINKLYTYNQDAFRSVYEKYSKLVYYVIKKLVRDGEVAKELSQDTFVKMWKKIHSFDQNSNFQAWLLTIAKNTARDYLRCKKKIELCDEDVIKSNYFPQKLFDEFDLDCKGILNELEYSIIILSAVYHLKRKEVAEILGKPLGTILRVHNEATDKLKAFYNLNDKKSK
jgi:RNA polymerase sigma-70 factor (ECF subfamily)